MLRSISADNKTAKTPNKAKSMQWIIDSTKVTCSFILEDGQFSSVFENNVNADDFHYSLMKTMN